MIIGRSNTSEELKEFNSDRLGTLWLKVKSIVRREYINQFCQDNDIELKSTRLNSQFNELYNILFKNVDESHEILNYLISSQNKSQLYKLDTDNLVQELY